MVRDLCRGIQACFSRATATPSRSRLQQQLDPDTLVVPWLIAEESPGAALPPPIRAAVVICVVVAACAGRHSVEDHPDHPGPCLL
jgi:hypothetical protein